MGHGWEITSRTIDSERPCKCGAGTVITYKLEEESDFPPFERDGGFKNELKCPNRCEYK